MNDLKIPVGISDFTKIRENGYYYIDKTELICSLLEPEPAEVTLITRPRRFGKTLGMSMLASFLDIRKDSGSLFEGLEILEQVAGPIDGFCSGIGTGGTITGIGETLKALNPQIEIWAVEPENAAILAGGTVSTHIQMGIGDGVIPGVLNQKIYDDIYIVSDEEALRTAKDLASKEGLMCGISSGTNVAAALRLAKKLGKGKTVVTILPDTAERYFSTPLFE